ncbi:MAG: leucine-rich repeat domain-containing protein [Erysipelotrichaceae bacterium]|nr:leucine-rich repeat domain-containing protein [Erysipelotrichaceae bacterium]
MRRIKIITVIFALCLSFMTACQSEEKKYAAMGLTFTQVKDATGYNFLYSAEEIDDKAYICSYNANYANNDTIEIPAKFKKKPVIAATSTSFNNSVKSVVFSEGIEYIENGFSGLSALQEITFPSTLKAIYSSFTNCQSLETVHLTNEMRKIDYSFTDCANLKDLDFSQPVNTISHSFTNCPLLKRVIIPGKCNHYSSFNDDTTILFGKKEIIEYSETYIDSNALTKQAKSHIAKDFDESKRVFVNDTTNFSGFKDYKDKINGPIVVTKSCPDCLYKDYGKDKLPKKLELSTVEVYTIENSYPDTVYTESKIEQIKNKEPIIYCFVEMIGYAKGPTYTFGGNNVGSYLYYRISIWNHSTNELLAWGIIDTGYAPSSFTWGKDTVTFSVPFGDNSTKSFFLEKDDIKPTPLYVVGKYIFGVTPEEESSES